MKYHYEPGATRWLCTTNDPRGHCPPKGWSADADTLEYHPVTGNRFETAQWWIKETYIGEKA